MKQQQMSTTKTPLWKLLEGKTRILWYMVQKHKTQRNKVDLLVQNIRPILTHVLIYAGCINVNTNCYCMYFALKNNHKAQNRSNS